jgi:hypothetical protein
MLDRPQLDWKDVSTYDSLAEFDLLQECRVDIRQQPWANTQNRQVVLHCLKLERAEEERRRLNVEISRLVDWMTREESQLKSVVDRLHSEGSPLAVEANTLLVHHLHQNNIHRKHIQKIYTLPCYSGHRDPTIEFWGITSERHVQGDGLGGGNLVHIELEANISAEEDDVAGDELDRLNDFLGRLSILDSM